MAPAHTPPQLVQRAPDAAAVPSGEQAAALSADGREDGGVSCGAEQQGVQPVTQPPLPHQLRPLLTPQPQPAMSWQQHSQQHAQPPWQQLCPGGGSFPALTVLPQGQPPQPPPSWSLHGCSQQASCSPSLPVAGREEMRDGTSAMQPAAAHAASQPPDSACAAWGGSSCPGSAAPWLGCKPAGTAWENGGGGEEDVPDELMLEALQRYEGCQGSALHAQRDGGAGGQQDGGREHQRGSEAQGSRSLVAPFLLDLCQL